MFDFVHVNKFSSESSHARAKNVTELTMQCDDTLNSLN